MLFVLVEAAEFVSVQLVFLFTSWGLFEADAVSCCGQQSLGSTG